MPISGPDNFLFYLKYRRSYPTFRIPLASVWIGLKRVSSCQKDPGGPLSSGSKLRLTGKKRNNFLCDNKTSHRAATQHRLSQQPYQIAFSQVNLVSFNRYWHSGNFHFPKTWKCPFYSDPNGEMDLIDRKVGLLWTAKMLPTNVSLPTCLQQCRTSQIFPSIA